MSTVSNHVIESFPRQRKNLIVMSLVVACFELLGVQFHTLNLLGNKVVIHNQNLVHWTLWAFLIYYLWRYITCFIDLGDKGIIKSFYGWRTPHLHSAIIAHAASSDIVKSILAESPELEISSSSTNYLEDGPLSIKGYIFFSFGEKGTGRILRQERVDVFITGMRLIIPTALSIYRIIFRSSLFNEYLFPYFLFILPLLFADSSVVSWLLHISS